MPVYRASTGAQRRSGRAHRAKPCLSAGSGGLVQQSRHHLQSGGRLEAAMDAYRRAIAIDPGHANAYSNLGVLLRATGKPSEAEAAYRTAIRLNPDHIDAYTQPRHSAEWV